MEDLKKGAEELKKNMVGMWSSAFSSSEAKFKGQGHRLGGGDSVAASPPAQGRDRAAPPAGSRDPAANLSGAAAERLLYSRYESQQKEMERQKEERRKALLMAQQQQQQQQRQLRGQGTTESRGEASAGSAGPSTAHSAPPPPAGDEPFDPFRPHFASGASLTSSSVLPKARVEETAPPADVGGGALVECPVCGRYKGSEVDVAAHVEACLAAGVASEVAITQPEESRPVAKGLGPPQLPSASTVQGREAATGPAAGQASGLTLQGLETEFGGHSGAEAEAESKVGEERGPEGAGAGGFTPAAAAAAAAAALPAAASPSVISQQTEPDSDALEEVQHACAVLLSSSPSTDILQVLRKLLSNLALDPENDKFQRIRLSNPKISQTVGASPGALAVLSAVGFMTRREGSEDWAVLAFRGAPAHKAVLTEALALIPDPAKDGERQEEQGAVATSPSVASGPVKPSVKFDRQVRVFLSTSENSAARIEVPESFFDRSGEEVRQEAMARRRALESSQVLMTRAMKEKQKEAGKRKYKLCVIRVHFPDGLVLQGLFRPWELTSALYEFVAGALKDAAQEFHLQHSVPMAGRSTVIPSPGSSSPLPSLEKEALVPASLIKFRPTCLGPPGYTGLRRDLLECVEPLTTVPLPQAHT